MIRLTILGEPFSKANSRKLVKFGDRPASIKSSGALLYEKSAIMQIPDSAKQMLTDPVAVTMRIYYATQRKDLDESLILDCLQAKKSKGEIVRRGVYVNDRQVKEKHIYHFIDKSCPRAEIEVRII